MKESYLNSVPVSRGTSAVSSNGHHNLPKIVKAIAQIHFEGNIIPHEWFKHVKLPSGKPDIVGLILLAEIVYWYRPIITIDEETGQQITQRKKFKGDMFQSSLGYYEGKFGLTKDQVRQALKRLEAGGFIRREYRDVVQRGVKLTRVTFVEPVAERICEITHPGLDTDALDSARPQDLEGDRCVPQGAVSVPQGAVQIPPYVDLLETTTKTYKDFPKTTTTTTQAQAQNETSSSSGSSGGSKLIFDFSLVTLTTAQRQRAAKILEGLNAEIAQQVLDEFNYAVSCGCIKKSKWAWLQGVARSARKGLFIPTSDLTDRRQAQVQATAIQLPQRKPNQAWEEHHEELLRNGITPADYHTYIAPLRGSEDDRVLWLEAPNSFAADWVLAHLPQIEQVMKPYTVFPIRVCIG